jgi:aryl-alcohol dehydrogenase-like predicted oxidoreductase
VIECGEVLQALLDARHKGRILFIGASVYGEDAALAAIDSGAFDVLQIAYSALDRRAEQRVIPAAVQADVGIVARSVLLKGALTDRYRNLPDGLAELKQAVMRMQRAVCNGMHELPEVAYRYVLTQPVPHSALVGTSSIEELQQVLRFADAGDLPSQTVANIRSTAMPDPFYLNPGNWPL